MLKCTHVCFFCSWCCIYKHDLSTSFKKGSKVPQSFSRFHCIFKISRSCHFLLLLLKVFWKTKIVDYENIMKPRTKFQQCSKPIFYDNKMTPLALWNTYDVQLLFQKYNIPHSNTFYVCAETNNIFEMIGIK